MASTNEKQNLLGSGSDQKQYGVRIEEKQANVHWDHGYAWVIAVAACLCNMVVMGTVKSAGIILNIVEEHFAASTLESVGFIVVHVFALVLFTPLATHLSNRVSCRVLVMFGGGVISAGLIFSAFVNNVFLTYLGLGFICGSGGAFILPTSYIIINQYFQDKRPQAFSISTLGMGLGALTLSPFLAFVFEYYGYTGAFLLMGGLFLHIQVVGALMRPPPLQHRTNLGELSDSVNGTSSQRPKTRQLSQSQSSYNKRQEEQFLKRKSGCENILRDEYTPEPRGGPIRRLLTNVTFLFYLFCIFCHTFPSSTTFLPSFALELGIPIWTSSLLLSVNGLGDIFGRLASGLIFTKLYFYKKEFHAFAGIISGLLVIVYGVTDNVYQLGTISFFHGMVEGAFNAQRTAVTFDFVATEDMSPAIGLIIVVECTGFLVGPVAMAILAALKGTFAFGFFIGGAVFAGSAAILLFKYALEYCGNDY